MLLPCRYGQNGNMDSSTDGKFELSRTQSLQVAALLGLTAAFLKTIGVPEGPGFEFPEAPGNSPLKEMESFWSLWRLGSLPQAPNHKNLPEVLQRIHMQGKTCGLGYLKDAGYAPGVVSRKTMPARWQFQCTKSLRSGGQLVGGRMSLWPHEIWTSTPEVGRGW